jgi:NAD+ synthetase
MRITLAQINPTIGDLDGNLALMQAQAQAALAEGARIIVFPELSLTGYYPGDLLDESHFAPRLAAATERLHRATRETPGLHWVVGLPLREDTGARQRHVNALQVIRDGQVLATYRKQLLPTYDVFDERRHFSPGPDTACVVRIGALRVGFLICEDGWNFAQHDYPIDPWKRLAEAAPDLVVSINASPAHRGKREQRLQLFQTAAASLGLPLAYVNQVGGQDQLVYDGSSFALQADGRLAAELPAFESQRLTLDFEPATTAQATTKSEVDASAGQWVSPALAEGARTALLLNPGAHALPAGEFDRRLIVCGLRDYARRCGFRRVLVGCSGGIDSALTLALAADALGPENVEAITMPSAVSSHGSVSDSEQLCRNLGVRLHTVPIAALVQQFDTTMQSALGEVASGIARENLQPRIRATLLMTWSNLHGHLLLTTGNKSESLVGFCTLGGDTMGGLNLIGDLYKTEVWPLAAHLNAHAGRELIPQAIIDKAPSAELAEGQLDEQRLPPYPVLDTILKATIEDGCMAPDEQAAVDAAMAHMNPTTVAQVRHLIATSEYKRRQSPPILRLRARAIGAGRQVPIAARHFAPTVPAAA